jgi:hypothetical protein
MSRLGNEAEPCWIVLGCSKYVYPNCPAYHYRERPCWENAYTQNEILLGIKRDCKGCRVSRLCRTQNGRPQP